MTSADKPPEHRRASRRKTLKGARILFPNGISTMACKVRDQSDTGALIFIEIGSAIPDEFILIMDGEDLKRPCNVAWRRPGKMGVRYVEALSDRRHHVASVVQQEADRESRQRAAETAAADPASEPQPRSRLLRKPISH